MRPLRYSINVTLDGCVDHRAGLPPIAATHLHATAALAAVDAIILGRTTYELMEFWRTPDPNLPDWMVPFADTLNPMRKYLVSTTRRADGWNTEQLEGDPVEAVRALKAHDGGPLAVGGVTLPLALAEAGLIDEVELVVHPIVAGQGPRLFDGLSSPMKLEPVGVTELGSGFRALAYAVVVDEVG